MGVGRGGHRGVRGKGSGVGAGRARLTWAPSRKMRCLMLQRALPIPGLPAGALSQVRGRERACGRL